MSRHILAAPVIRPLSMHFQKLLWNKPCLPLLGSSKLLQEIQGVIICLEIIPNDITPFCSKPCSIPLAILMDGEAFWNLCLYIGGKTFLLCKFVKHIKIAREIFYSCSIVRASESGIGSPLLRVLISVANRCNIPIFPEPFSAHIHKVFGRLRILRKFLDFTNCTNKVFLKFFGLFQILGAVFHILWHTGICNILIQRFPDFVSCEKKRPGFSTFYQLPIVGSSPNIVFLDRIASLSVIHFREIIQNKTSATPGILSCAADFLTEVLKFYACFHSMGSGGFLGGRFFLNIRNLRFGVFFRHLCIYKLIGSGGFRRLLCYCGCFVYGIFFLRNRRNVQILRRFRFIGSGKLGLIGSLCISGRPYWHENRFPIIG